ncbi:hypothetical protein SLEP1_g49611 [Rubroshorea leprosula]|uniref:Uncharacterized protein n=1 Tax=Rubroshorea leprosula TaxID=152421 RepID=A0AAV5LZF0_9ROSI|nr:hypothetical protein SLEP1_g49611 [Rubroshorea leprosula]
MIHLYLATVAFFSNSWSLSSNEIDVGGSKSPPSP